MTVWSSSRTPSNRIIPVSFSWTASWAASTNTPLPAATAAAGSSTSRKCRKIRSCTMPASPSSPKPATLVTSCRRRISTLWPVLPGCRQGISRRRYSRLFWRSFSTGLFPTSTPTPWKGALVVGDLRQRVLSAKRKAGTRAVPRRHRRHVRPLCPTQGRALLCSLADRWGSVGAGGRLLVCLPGAVAACVKILLNLPDKCAMMFLHKKSCFLGCHLLRNAGKHEL